MYNTRQKRSEVDAKKMPILLGILGISILFSLKSCTSTEAPYIYHKPANQLDKYNAYQSFLKISGNPLEFKINPTILKERQACLEGELKTLRSIKDLQLEKTSLEKILAMDIDSSKTSSVLRWDFEDLDNHALLYSEHLDEIIKLRAEEQPNEGEELSDELNSRICHLFDKDSAYSGMEAKFYEFADAKNNTNSPEQPLSLFQQNERQALKYVREMMLRFKRIQEQRIKMDDNESTNIDTHQQLIDILATMKLLLNSADNPNDLENAMQAELATLQTDILINEAKSLLEGKKLQEALTLIQKNSTTLRPKTSQGESEWEEAEQNINQKTEKYQEAIRTLRPNFDSAYRYFLLLESWQNSYNAWLKNPDALDLKEKLQTQYLLLEQLTQTYIYLNESTKTPTTEEPQQTNAIDEEKILAAKEEAYLKFFNQTSYESLDFTIDTDVIRERQACAANQTEGLRSLKVFRKQKMELDIILSRPQDMFNDTKFTNIDSAATDYHRQLERLLTSEDIDPILICSLYEPNSTYTKFEDRFYILVRSMQNDKLIADMPIHKEYAVKALQEIEYGMFNLKRRLELRYDTANSSDSEIEFDPQDSRHELVDKYLRGHNASTFVVDPESSKNRIAFEVLDILIRSIDEPGFGLAAGSLDKMLKRKERLENLTASEKSYIKGGVAPPRWSDQQIREWNDSDAKSYERSKDFLWAGHSIESNLEAYQKYRTVLTDWYKTYDQWLKKPTKPEIFTQLNSKYIALRQWNRDNIYSKKETEPHHTN